MTESMALPPGLNGTHPPRSAKPKTSSFRGDMIPQEELNELALDIIRGTDGEAPALKSLRRFKKEGKAALLSKKINFWKHEQSLLHVACKFRANLKIIKKLIDICPEQLRVTRSENYAGQTVLHIAVSSKKHDIAELILEKFKELADGLDVERSWLLKQRATGPRFANTAMMGELPLSIAALTGDKDMVRLLLQHGAEIFAQNSHGDNVFHSIIKYARIYPEKIQELIEMCKMLNKELKARPAEELQDDYEPDCLDPLSVWQHTNEDSLTPLHMAAQLGQAELFKLILTLDNVYCRSFSGEGLFDIHRYDITEIDNTAHARFLEWHDDQEARTRAPHDVDSVTRPNKMDDTVDVHCLPTVRKNEQVYRHQSVLDTISLRNFKQAKDLIDRNGIVRAIIRKKWARYQYCYYVWGIVHLVYMGLLTWFAVAKTVVMSHVANSTSAPAPSQVQTNFVLVFSISNFFTAVALVGVEAWRYIVWKKPLHLHRIHHNGIYRLILLVFGLSLLWDSLHYWIVTRNSVQQDAITNANLGVTLALLLGWWFVTFFLRGFHKFSYLTVMFQKVLLGDFVRFVVVILLVLVAFSATLHMALLQSDPHMQDDYAHTLFTTFLFMLGFGEARVEGVYAPWLTSVLHIAFLLLTTLLMLNALIAMMTNTCTMVAGDRKLQWELQRLAVILFLERMLLAKWRVMCGKERKVTIFSFRQNSAKRVSRYYMEFTTLRSLDSRSDEAGVGAPSLSSSLWSSQFPSSRPKWHRTVSSLSSTQSTPSLTVHSYPLQGAGTRDNADSF